MSMVCPKCSSAHEQRLQCPSCNERLVYHPLRGAPARPVSGRPARWQQTPWGRILIGLILAQGLYYGLQHLLMALLMALSNHGLLNLAWTSTYGLLLVQALQLLALVLGGVLAGGGQRSGTVLGAVVGGWNGVLAVLIEPILHPDMVPVLTTVALCGQPLVHVAFGALGGWIGCTIWRPVAAAKPPASSGAVRKAGVARKVRPLFAGRVAWVRIALGVAVALAGYFSAGMLFNLILDVASGKLSSDTIWQDRMVTWEIQALWVLVGAAVAGYGTPNGMKQGLFVGVGLGVVLIAVSMLSLRPTGPVTVALSAVGAFGLSLAGGWFGSQLFPPVLRLRADRGLEPASLT